jgi:hypothetical protein
LQAFFEGFPEPFPSSGTSSKLRVLRGEPVFSEERQILGKRRRLSYKVNSVKGKPKYDGFKFWVWFFCGALCGAFVGVRVWGRSRLAMAHSMRPGMVIILVSALIGGIIGAVLSNAGADE